MTHKHLEIAEAVKFLNPINTAPKDGTYILLFGDSGYSGTPLRCEICKYDARFRPHQPWVNYSSDSFLDGGSGPLGWLPLPWETHTDIEEEKMTDTRLIGKCPNCGMVGADDPTPAAQPCEACNGTGEFQGGRMMLQKPICPECKGSGKAAPTVPDEVAAARVDEREACCKAVCILCKNNVPMSENRPTTYHQHPDYQAWCSAYAIRSRSTILVEDQDD